MESMRTERVESRTWGKHLRQGQMSSCVLGFDFFVHVNLAL